MTSTHWAWWSIALRRTAGVGVGQRAEPVVVVLEQVGVDRPDPDAEVGGVGGELAVVVDQVPRDVQRDPRRDAGVPVHLGGVLELLVRVAGDAGLAEHLEPGAGVAERPRGQLDGLLRPAPRGRGRGGRSRDSPIRGPVGDETFHSRSGADHRAPGRNVSTARAEPLRSRAGPDVVDASTDATTAHRRTPDHQHPGRRRARRRLGGHRQQRPQPARRRSARTTRATGARPPSPRSASSATSRPASCGPGRSRTIGLVVLDIANPFFTDVARGVEEVANAAGPRGHPLQLRRPAGQGGRPPRRARRAAGAGRAHHADRRALPAPGRRCATAACPSCCVDRRAPDADQCSVAVDDVLGGRLAAEHLLERGHRRIAFVGGSLGPAAGAGAARRRRAGGPGGAAGPTTR